MVYALAAAESSCGDLVRCTLGDGVSLCPQRCAAMAQDAETPSTQQYAPPSRPRVPRRPCMLGIEVLEVKFMGGTASTAHLQDTRVSNTSWRVLVRVSSAGGRQSAGWQRYVL